MLAVVVLIKLMMMMMKENLVKNHFIGKFAKLTSRHTLNQQQNKKSKNSGSGFWGEGL